MDFDQEECERFIKMVSEHPCLYDPVDMNYKDSLLRDSIWEGIAQNCNRSAEYCRTKWRNLKDSYTRFIRRYKQTGQIDKRTHYRTYKHMTFLNGSISAVSRIRRPPAPPRVKKSPMDADNPIIVGMEHIVFNKSLDIFQPKYRKHNPTEAYNGPVDNPLKKLEKSNVQPVNSSSNEIKITKEATLQKIQPTTTAGTIPKITLKRRLLDEKNAIIINKGTTLTTNSDNNNIVTSVTQVSLSTNSDNGNILASIAKSSQEVTQSNQDITQSNQDVTQSNQDEETPEEDSTITYFTTHVKEVLKKLPPVLQIQAKQEMFRVLTKYELIAVDYTPSSPNNKTHREKNDPLPSVITIKDEIVTIKDENNYYDNAIEVKEEII